MVEPHPERRSWPSGWSDAEFEWFGALEDSFGRELADARARLDEARRAWLAENPRGGFLSVELSDLVDEVVALEQFEAGREW